MYPAWFFVCSRQEGKAGPIITSWLCSESFEKGSGRHFPRVFQPQSLVDLFYLIHQEARVQPSQFHFIGWETEAMTQASWSPQMGLMVMNEIKSCKIPHLARSVLWEILDLRISPRLHPDFPCKPTPPPHSGAQLPICTAHRFTEHFD